MLIQKFLVDPRALHSVAVASGAIKTGDAFPFTWEVSVTAFGHVEHRCVDLAERYEGPLRFAGALALRIEVLVALTRPPPDGMKALASLPIGSAAISAIPIRGRRSAADRECQPSAALVLIAPLTALAEDGPGVALKMKGSSEGSPVACAAGSVFFTPAQAPRLDEDRDSYVPRVSWQSPEAITPMSDPFPNHSTSE